MGFFKTFLLKVLFCLQQQLTQCSIDGMKVTFFLMFSTDSRFLLLDTQNIGLWDLRVNHVHTQ